MNNAIKLQIDSFGAYSSVNDWGLETVAGVEIYVNNGHSKGYVHLSIEQAHQAIDIIKDAIKQAEKDVKKAEKQQKKYRGGRERF